MPPTLSIELRGGQQRYCPGDRVEGNATISTGGDEISARVQLALYWKTEGRGDDDTGTVALEELNTEGRQLPPISQLPFSFVLPPLPWSYQGVALKIHWYVGLFLVYRIKRDNFAQVPLIVHPNPDSMPLPSVPQ